MIDGFLEPGQHFRTRGPDLLGVVRHQLALVAELNCSQHPENGRWRRQDDVSGKDLLQQQAVGFQSTREQRLQRKKHDNKVWADVGFPVTLGRKFLGSRQDVLRVFVQVRVHFGFVVGLDCPPIGVEGKLRVNENLAASRQIDNNVRAGTAGLGHTRVLTSEVNSLDKARMLEQLLELHLPPLTTGLA